MWGLILVIVLIGGVYAFGKYTSNKEEKERDISTKKKETDIIIKIIIALIMSNVIVFTFISLFSLLGFQQEQVGIVVAIIIVFTIILCTCFIIEEIRKISR
ncbi:MAG: hypothetical protein Q4Q02_02465 [Clostridium sp.]|nr:hypothetical protein [Clostridium sp.]